MATLSCDRRTSKPAESPEEALERIQCGFSANDMAVMLDLASRGVPLDSISPRQNVLTFHAWKAKGRRVAKGAISVRVITWVPCSERQSATQEEDGAEPSKPKPRAALRPKTAYLFHASQTVDVDAPRGTLPEAWDNHELIRQTEGEGEDKRK